jgi:serine/threonine protein kinase
MADVVFGDCLGWENGVPPLSKTLTIDSEYNGDDSKPANLLDKVTVKEPGQDKIETSKVQKIQKDLFYFDELSLGNKLGQGCFGVVFEVQQFMPLADNDSNFDEDRLFARRYYSDQKNEDPTGKCKYAVKYLREDFDTPRQFKVAARDMETEADLLATIDHPRIVKMYAKSASGTKFMKCTKDNFQDFFIVMDVLSGTLSGKILEWRLEERRMATAPLFTKKPASESMKKKKILVERLRVSHDIASAIAYLHGQSIVYRDLKADNVGFGFDGRCKLFDFGFARRLPDDPEKKMKNDTYVMSGQTGSIPHMAPEVWKEKPYNEKADLYSYAVLVWVILTLEMPYFEFARDVSMLTKRVMDEGHRPPINGKWPKKLQILLGKAWSEDVDERPTMEQVCITLKAIIASELPKSEKAIRRSFF